MEISCFQAPRYPEYWRNNIVYGPQVLWGVVGLSPFMLFRTLRTGRTQCFQCSWHPEDRWRLSHITPPGAVKTIDAQLPQNPSDPNDWRQSALSAPQVPRGVVESAFRHTHSHCAQFSLHNTLDFQSIHSKTIKHN